MCLRNLQKFSFILVTLIILISSASSFARLSREDSIAERLAPIGNVYLSGGSSLDTKIEKKLSKDAGVKRYKSMCFACHDTGASGAPKVGDKALWANRIKSQSIETIYKHAIEGYKAMPAKGGCISCADEEIKMAVDYMLEKSK
tara:strand:+ start:9968 stop:10399 length:432 start_codon:yes stop_codon:yes gene_type:complete